MTSFSDGHTKIRGLGAYTPPEILSSREVMEQVGSERLGLPAEWLERALGVRERRVAPEGTLPSDIAAHAAREALDRACLLPGGLDLVIYTGMNRDHLEPSTAHVVARKIGAKHATCLDLTAACHGFAQGTHYADLMIAHCHTRNALIVSGETNWRIARRAIEKFKTCASKTEFMEAAGVLTVGDGAGAMVLGPSDAPDQGFIGFGMEGRPEHAELCVCDEDDDGNAIAGHMDMIGIVGAYMDAQKDLYHALMQRIGWCADSINWFVHHQVGRKLFKYHQSYSGVDSSRITDTFTRHGNLTSATIPYNLYLLQESAKEGDRVFIAAAGSGLSLSEAAYTWG